MRVANWIRQCRWLLVAGLLAVAGRIAPAQDDATQRAPGRPDTTLLNDVGQSLAEHWIGVRCIPVGDALRAHLELADDQGMLVAHVADHSPAAKAGLKRHDILLKAGDIPIHSTQELIKAVGKSQGEAIDFKILRAGKEQNVTIEPERRPEKADQVEVEVHAPVPDGPEFRRSISKWMRNQGLNRVPARYRRFAEGWLADRPRHLPEGVVVTITKEGEQPARITVTEAGQTWEVTEHELHKLPENARLFVAGMLGRVEDVDVEVEILGPAERKARDYLKRFEEILPNGEGLERRIEELEKRLEDVMDELRTRRETRDEQETDRQGE